MTGPELDPAAVTDDRPWDLPGAARRDCAPHRGNVLALLGQLSLACGLLSCLLGVPALLGLPVSVVTIFLAKHDLYLMWEGTLDPRGRQQTELARRRREYGVVLNALGPFASVLSWCVLLAFLETP